MADHNNPENSTGFKPGQKLLYLTELGGQPHQRIVTYVREVEVGRIGNEYNAVTVQEFAGYVEQDRLYSLDSIVDMFNDYTPADARRWRAIHDGITPAAMLSNEEIDKVIDDNEEWCKAYGEVNKNDPSPEEPITVLCPQCKQPVNRTYDHVKGGVGAGVTGHYVCPKLPEEPEKGVWMGDKSIDEYEDDPGRCCMTDCFGYRCEKRTGHKGKHNVGNPKDPFYNPVDDPEKEPGY